MMGHSDPDPEALAFIGTSDLAGLLRGKSIPAVELAARIGRGVGITHSNLMLSPFGPILDTPFGTVGDLLLVADPSTQTAIPVPGGPDIALLLGDFRHLDQSPWECCPRGFLARALAALEAEFGLRLLATFEQEMVYTGVEEQPGSPYTLDALRRQGAFGGTLLAFMRQAGIEPDSFLSEYGQRQYEVTCGPRLGMRAADEAVLVRELARAVAAVLGHRALLSPILHPDGVGSGTHIHWSLQTTDGVPVTYDPAGLHGMSAAAEAFSAGLLAHLPALVAVTAPSGASYVRLRPNRWAPTSVDLGVQDRGSALRICPVAQGSADSIARQFNIEYRVADATASPYLALGALVWAGLDGVRRGLRVADCTPQTLPASLGQALDLFAASPATKDWFGPLFHEVYCRYKRAEVKRLAGLDDLAICQLYATIY